MENLDKSTEAEKELFECQMVIINSFGKFFGKKFTMDKEAIDSVTEHSKNAFKSSSLEITTENGELIIFPNKIVENSILKIKINKIENNG